MSDEDHLENKNSIEQLGLGPDSELCQMIHSWAQRLAENAETQCEYVDLLYKSRETLASKYYRKSFQLESKHSPTTYQSDERLDDEKVFIKGECKSVRNSSTTVLRHSIKMGTEVKDSQNQSVTQSINLGLSMSIQPGSFGNLGATISFNRTSVKGTTHEDTKTSSEEEDIEIPPYYEAVYIRNIWKVPHRRKYTIILNLKGDVPIKFVHKVSLRNNAFVRARLFGHRKHFLPIKYVLENLKLPAEIYQPHHGDVQQLTIDGTLTVKICEPQTTVYQTPLNTKKSNLTAEVSHFKGKRLDELKTRIQELEGSNEILIKCAITGVAGCGKSELAKVYASKWGDPLTTFRWRLDPDPNSDPNNASNFSYQQAFAQLLTNFGIQDLKAYETETPEHHHQRLNDMLWNTINNSCPQWIIIFDNAGSLNDIKKYLPPPFIRSRIKPQILVTTRNPFFFKESPQATFPINIPPPNPNFSINKGLHEDDAIELLQRMSHRSQEDPSITKDLVHQLDFLPLGIRIAGSYIYNVPETSFNSYKRLLEQKLLTSLIEAMGSDFIQQAIDCNQLVIPTETLSTLPKAITFSVLKLQKDNPVLLDLLQYCAYLANEGITFELLFQLFKQQNSLLIEESLRTKLVEKNNYCLITYDNTTKTYYLHRTTQTILRDMTSNPVNRIQTIVNAILKLYPYYYYSIDKIKLCQRMEPHFLALSSHIKSDHKISKALVTEQLNLLLILAQVAYKFSQYTQSLKYLRESEILAQNTPTMNLAIQADIFRYFANIYYYLGDFKESRECIDKALKITTDVYTTQSWRQARLYNILGNLLQVDINADLRDALVEYNKAATICENLHVSEQELKALSYELVSSYTGIGECSGHMKDFPIALKYLYKALGICQENVGENHPLIANTYNDLGALGLLTNEDKFVDVGVNFSTSLGYLNKSIEICKQGYGVYNVTISYHWISRLLYVSTDPADWEKALYYRNQMIEIRRKIYGDKFYGLIESYCWLEKILKKLNKNEEAQKAHDDQMKLRRVNISNSNQRLEHYRNL